MPTLTFHRMYPETLPPLRADKSAFGTMPSAAFQYCEAMRTASSHGWYVFPPFDIRLRWTGSEVLWQNSGTWETLTEVRLPEFDAYWDANAPESMRGLAPPFVGGVQVRGIVQVWSGLLVETAEGWNTLVRPIVNAPLSHLYSPYEGVIETDRFSPCPLFTNLQLTSTEVVIELCRHRPLFQVQPVRRECYSDVAHDSEDHEGFEDGDGDGGLSDAQWQGFRRTIRTDQPDDVHSPGAYASGVRKRAKRS
jgi:hypothetical protein